MKNNDGMVIGSMPKKFYIRLEADTETLFLPEGGKQGFAIADGYLRKASR